MRLRVRRPADLLAVVPYLLGFQPDESLVAVLVRGGRVLLTVRMDLAPAPPGWSATSRSWSTSTPLALVLVAYSAEPERGRAVSGRAGRWGSPLRPMRCWSTATAGGR